MYCRVVLSCIISFFATRTELCLRASLCPAGAHPLSSLCDWILKWHLLGTLHSNRDGSSKQPLQQTDLQLQQTFFLEGMV